MQCSLRISLPLVVLQSSFGYWNTQCMVAQNLYTQPPSPIFKKYHPYNLTNSPHPLQMLQIAAQWNQLAINSLFTSSRVQLYSENLNANVWPVLKMKGLKSNQSCNKTGETLYETACRPSCALSAWVCVLCSAPARQITRSFPEGSGMRGNGNEKSEAVSCKDTWDMFLSNDA